jgi:hypothetical protein
MLSGENGLGVHRLGERAWRRPRDSAGFERSDTAGLVSQHPGLRELLEQACAVGREDP